MNYSIVNDYEVLYMVCENEDDAIDILFNKYHPLLTKILWKNKYLLKKFGIDREDFEQQLYFYFLNAVRTYNQDMDVKFVTYLMTILNNNICHYFRKLDAEKRKSFVNSVSLSKTISEDGEILLEDILSDKECLVDDIISAKILTDYFYKFIYSLNVMNASILELYYCGFSISDISLFLDVSSANISRILYSLKKRFKKTLDINYS